MIFIYKFHQNFKLTKYSLAQRLRKIVLLLYQYSGIKNFKEYFQLKQQYNLEDASKLKLLCTYISVKSKIFEKESCSKCNYNFENFAGDVVKLRE